MVGKALKILLSGSASASVYENYELYKLIGKNIFPNVLPQNYGTPSVVYTITNTEPASIKYFRSLATTIDFDIDVLTETYSDLIKISTLIIYQLNRYKNSYNNADSTQQGFGTHSTISPSTTTGLFTPPSGEYIQYMGGLQIVGLDFINASEHYDEKLELYRNTLDFKMTYIEDPSVWGSDIYLKLDDLNLMSTTSTGGDPLYKQPISVNDGVNYLFCPSSYLSNNTNIPDTSLDNFYPVFNDPSGTSNTNRPTLKQNGSGVNYLEFDSSKYLKSLSSSAIVLRKYKEVTIFTVFSVPNSTYIPRETCITFKESGESSEVTPIFIYSTNTGGETGVTNYYIGVTLLQDDGSGGTTHQGVTLFNILKWPLIGLNSNIDFSDPVYFAFSLQRSSDTQMIGQAYIITSSDFTVYGDINVYTDHTFTNPLSLNYKQEFFNLQSFHSDVTSFNTIGHGTLDMNDPINIYDFCLCPKKIVFGSSKFMDIQNEILIRNKMFNKKS